MKHPNKLDWLVYRIFKWWWDRILLNNYDLWRQYVSEVNRLWRAKEGRPESGKKDEAKRDKFFITEITNDLHRNGFIPGGKAETMLHDWSAELRERSRVKFPASRLKKLFCFEVGRQNW